MNWKVGLIHGTMSAVLASLASLIYNKVYSEAFLINFDKVMGSANIVASSTIGCMLMALGYVVISKWNDEKLKGTLNLLYVILSFASIIGVLSFTLPLDIESPEMFPGLAIPMHFFPVLAFTSIYPFFKYHNS